MNQIWSVKVLLMIVKIVQWPREALFKKSTLSIMSSHLTSHLLSPNLFPPLPTLAADPNIVPATSVPNPPDPLPPDPSPKPTKPVATAFPTTIPLAVNPKKVWTSLFKTLPKNAGSYKPMHFELTRDGSVKPLPTMVQEEGIKY